MWNNVDAENMPVEHQNHPHTARDFESCQCPRTTSQTLRTSRCSSIGAAARLAAVSEAPSTPLPEKNGTFVRPPTRIRASVVVYRLRPSPNVPGLLDFHARAFVHVRDGDPRLHWHGLRKIFINSLTSSHLPQIFCCRTPQIPLLQPYCNLPKGEVFPRAAAVSVFI